MKLFFKWPILLGLILLWLILLFILLSYGLRTNTIYARNKDNSIDHQRNQLIKDGIVVIPHFISSDDIAKINQYIKQDKILDAKEHIIHSDKTNQKIHQLLGPNYVFHDYIFLIQKSQFHTCHRDYNGDFFNEGQQFPSYTIIIYLENMNKCLDIIPRSHQNMSDFTYNFSDYTQTIQCNIGDAILFNANLIHNGSLNENENNPRIQMKISHKADHQVLDFYNQYHKTLNVDNQSTPLFKHVQKHISCQFPIISHWVKQYDNNKDKMESGNVNLFSPLFAKLDTISNPTKLDTISNPTKLDTISRNDKW